MAKFEYSNEQIEKLINGIWEGEITEYDLPKDLYYAIADYLKSGLYKGFGGTLAEFSGKDLELLTELRENVYMFSAAKTYQEVLDIKSLMFNSDGERVSQNEFSQLGGQAFDTWNDAWGRTEYNTAVHSSYMAAKWNEIEKNKDLLPYLSYSTIGDACDICAPLNGMTKPVDDPTWDALMPPNHFNCLCIVTQEENNEGRDVDTSGVLEMMSDEFKMNPGKDGYIFKDDHPYFEVAKKDVAYAKNNFNLPIPEEDE